MAILELTANDWLDALGLPLDWRPAAIIVEGTWWRERQTRERLSRLESVKELAFPDMFIGRWNGRDVGYCCAYGAARAVEPVHLFCQLGARLAVQIGTCGGFQTQLETGDIIIPGTVIARDGVATLYGVVDCIDADDSKSARAEKLLRERGHKVWRGTHLTWPSLFAQSHAMNEGWRKAGYLSVDMESATTLGVAKHFGVPAVSLLVLWDTLSSKRSFLSPLTDEERQRLDASNIATFDAALSLVDELPASSLSNGTRSAMS
jgi:purine-nucleoside phosphorylase